MTYGMISIITCFVFVFTLMIIYLSKSRLNNFDNRMFFRILFLNISGLVLEFLCYVIIPMKSKYSVLNELINRVFLIFLLAWAFLMTIYEFNEICSPSLKIKNRFKRNSKIYKACIFVLFVVFAFLVSFTKLNYFHSGQYAYSYGTATLFVFMPVVLPLFIGLFLIFIFRKAINIKKIIPFFAMFFAIMIGSIIRFYSPKLLFITPIFSLVTFIMYFTIENPDMKMIEQLNIERDRADKANNAKTEFLSSMSHEIRTPLNAIDGFSQLILEEDNIDTIKEEAHDIMAASQNLLEIVNGILDISKIEADKLEIVNVEYEPSQIFKDVAVLAKSRIGEKPIEFKEHIAEDLPDYLNGDYTRIKQITLNLLTNAVKYTKDGYVDYSVRCVRQGDVCRLIIMVKDTGIGIKSENIDKLFNKFERFDKEQNITIEGTGLGLAITKKLVDLMHGKIIADSRYGKGSIFAVVVDQKIVDKVKDKTTEEVKEDKKTFEGYKVLVVDDNKINLKVASRLLGSYNITPDLVDSGFECIYKIQSGTVYSLILMDDMMPKMSGTEAFKKLKEIEGFNTPVIALTANAIAGMKEKYLKEGFNDYISKPIDKKELERVLNKYLN